jgi:Helix-turn-helix domain
MPAPTPLPLARSRFRSSTAPSPLPPVAPLAVPPEQARHILQIGMSHLYGLMHAGELDSFYSGRARRITMQSIHAYIERRLAAANNASERPASIVTPPRRRGRQQSEKRA